MLLRARVVVCEAGGKGFGDSSKQQTRKSGKGIKQKQSAPGIKSGDSKAVERALRLVEEQEERRRGPAARPVDPREAARGKVEYVKVKDWGSGEPEELGSLRVDSDATQVFATGSSNGSESGSESGSSDDGGMPFHEALARRLELLQTQGALGVAQLPGGKPLPAFELWAFKQQHYAQYLADMYAVHAAVEEGLAAAAAAESEALAAGASGQHQQPLLSSALGLFGADQGLSRSAALQQDLQRLAAAGSQQQQQAQPAADGQNVPPAPTQHAAAYAAYIASFGRLRRAAEGPQEAEQAVLRLLAHAYIIYLMHLTSGGRIAAAAVQKLDLATRDALGFYRDYPGLSAGMKPLELFVSNTNRLGKLLSEDQQESLMQELPKAMTKTSMLLVPLAREA